jgi:hypothetical protein
MANLGAAKQVIAMFPGGAEGPLPNRPRL